MAICSTATLDIWTTNFDLFDDLTGIIQWVIALEGKKTQDIWLIFKHHFFQVQHWCIPKSMKLGKSGRGLAWMNEIRKTRRSLWNMEKFPLGRNVRTLSGHAGMWWGRLRPTWNYIWWRRSRIARKACLGMSIRKEILGKMWVCCWWGGCPCNKEYWERKVTECFLSFSLYC